MQYIPEITKSDFSFLLSLDRSQKIVQITCPGFFFSDECLLSINKLINAENAKIRSTESLYAVSERGMNSPKVMVRNISRQYNKAIFF